MTKRVAIIGYSFRFPSTTHEQYWEDLLQGRDLVSQVEEGRWSDAYLHPNKAHPGTAHTFSAGSIGDVSRFDADFFGISPREAAQMDPQQRLLLEMSWEAIESAGIKPSSLRGSRCGVFVGIASADYAYRLADDLAATDSTFATGNTSSIAANRLSYFHDWHGPSMAIDTACSSSLVAFHQACRAIVTGEIPYALTGGISLHLHPYGFIVFSKASMLSPRGRCNVFDAAGDGYVRSEGGGLFLLKDLDLAIADGDNILAVVANSAVNTDGRKSGITVPNPAAQAELLRSTYAQAGIDPQDIDYLEAHGTGTAIGDPLETSALGEALGKKRPAGQPLLIGSVKSNLGHMETASGVAGLVKALYVIRHRTVPATIGIKTPNPRIHLKDWNLEIVTENRRLKQSGKLTLGVNSFGFGGANAHVILESPDAISPVPHIAAEDKPLPVVVTARTESGLKDAARSLSTFMESLGSSVLYDLAYHSVCRRDWFEHRALIQGTSVRGIAAQLAQFAADAPEASEVYAGKALENAQGPAFVYSGNGSQWFGMGQALLAEPIFLQAVRNIDTSFVPLAGFSLEAELARETDDSRFDFTEIAQPALFAMQVGITEMLRQQGIIPSAVTGHSVGEVAAAWASGALSLDAAVHVIFHRSRLQGETKGSGQMTAISLDTESAQILLTEQGLDRVCIASVNSSRGITLAGSAADLGQIEAVLAERGIFHKRLALDYAFHSPAMDVTEQGILTALADLECADASIPFHSTVTGSVAAGRSLNAEYWWHNIRRPVLFEQAIKGLITQGTNLFIEIGPHPVLRTYVSDCLKDNKLNGRVIPTCSRKDNSAQAIFAAAAQSVIAGGATDWDALFPTPGNFIELPHYAWQKEVHWHAATAESTGLLNRKRLHPLLGYKAAQHELTWENPLDTQTVPMLADHIIGDAIVFPGTGYVELALAAAAQWQPGSNIEIESLEIRAPLLLSADQTNVLRIAIDDSDGSLSIKAREYVTSTRWDLHAVGRIMREAGGTLLQCALPTLPIRQPDFNHSSYLALNASVGLHYGPAFCAIDFGWRTPEGIIAGLRIPESIEATLDQYTLHPGILDSAFQLIVQLLRDDISLADGMAYVPTQISRIAAASPARRPAYATATLQRRSPHSLLASFVIFDQDGLAIAALKDVRFRAIRLHKSAADQIRHLDYYCTPLRDTRDEGPSIPFEHVGAVMREAVRRGALKGSHRRYVEEIDPLLEELCTRFIVEAFTRVVGENGQLAGMLENARQANPAASAFLNHLLGILAANGMLVGTAPEQRLTVAGEHAPTAQDIWNSLIGDYPDYFPVIHAVGRTGMHLASLLSGSSGLQHIRSSETSPTRLARQILGARGRSLVGQALRTVIQQALATLPSGKRLGVLEIADSQQAYARDICTNLDFTRSDFCFAAFESEALDDAQRLKEQFPAMCFEHLDGTEHTESALLFDLVIISLDFMSPHNVVNALLHAKKRLVPGGALLLVGQHPAGWADFVFGVSQDWWTGETASLTPQQPLRVWQHQLEQLGYSNLATLEFTPETDIGPYLLLARNSTVASAPPRDELPSQRWLILADTQGRAAAIPTRVADLLIARGGHAIVAHISRPDEIEPAIRQVLALHDRLDGIVHAVGLGDCSAAQDIVSHQVDRCALAAEIVRACETSHCHARVWLLTSGVMSDALASQGHVSSGRSPNARHLSDLADAALWGFGRTLINESPDNPVHLIDLDDLSHVELVTTALANQLLSATNEDEVVIASDGRRFATRLRFLPRPEVAAAPSTLAPQTLYRLGFNIPGQLRNLHWEAYTAPALTDDQLEIEVRATGLNFRDVMYALGMLADEAIENGFAGPTLGMEFAGTVLRAGKNTKGFSVGDMVVGFGSSCFSNRITTTTDAISLIPPDISFEAAATIPSTFFTAYYALHHLAQLAEGERILIHGAAGGVGIAAIQIAKWRGAEIFATAGSDEKRDFLRMLGVDHILDSRSLAYADEIMALTAGQGIDVVLNSLAGEAINRNFRILRPFGRFLELGKRDFYENTRIGLRPFRNNITYFGIDADQLMVERPALTRQLFRDAMALFADGVLRPLPYSAFEAEDIVEAFRYMQQAKQIGKIVVTYRNGISCPRTPHPRARAPLALSAKASYLVTGGLSGFGLRTAEWLAAHGARQLILLSRSGPVSDEAKAGIERLQAQGVAVFATSCDITDKAALAAALHSAAQTMPPIRGIVHAAAVIEDGLIRNLDAAQIQRVLAPKINGAINLHELSADMTLDFFVLYSSGTTLFGNPGQGNYVAANAWLEALARHRRAQGQPATCVLWGAIDDVGLLARNEKLKEALQNRMGGTPLKSSLALDALESLMQTRRSGEGVLEIDWRALSRFLPSAGSTRFGEIARTAGDTGHADDNSDDIQRMLATLGDAELEAAFVEMLKQELGEILRIPPDKVDATRSIYDMGLDSLMGVELVVALESRFGVKLPVMALSESANIAKLAARLIHQLRSHESSDTPTPAADTADHIQQVASQHTVEVSAEVVASFAAELSEQDASAQRLIRS